MSGIGIILNPYSRSNKRRPERIEKFGFIVGDKGSCHSTETLDQVKDLAHEFMERDIDILGISGGDGTNHKTLTTFMGVYGEKPLPRIALLRGGTMNNLANQLGIKGTPEDILTNLIIKYHENIPFAEQEMNLVRVNGDYGFLFGMGLISRFIDVYQDVEGGPTPARGAWLLGRAMCSAAINGRFARHLTERFDCEMTIDGERQSFRNFMMIFAGTMRSLGFHFRPLYRSTSEPGKFQAVGISATGRQLLYTFPSAFLARPSRSEHYIDKMCGRMTLEFDRPMRYTVDGDFPEEPASRVEIETGPKLTCIVS